MDTRTPKNLISQTLEARTPPSRSRRRSNRHRSGTGRHSIQKRFRRNGDVIGILSASGTPLESKDLPVNYDESQASRMFTKVPEPLVKFQTSASSFGLSSGSKTGEPQQHILSR